MEEVEDDDTPYDWAVSFKLATKEYAKSLEKIKDLHVLVDELRNHKKSKKSLKK
jgi:hypothetical protein